MATVGNRHVGRDRGHRRHVCGGRLATSELTMWHTRGWPCGTLGGGHLAAMWPGFGHTFVDRYHRCVCPNLARWWPCGQNRVCHVAKTECAMLSIVKNLLGLSLSYAPGLQNLAIRPPQFSYRFCFVVRVRVCFEAPRSSCPWGRRPAERFVPPT